MHVERLSAQPSLTDEGRRLLEEYLRLPDGWEWFGGVPEPLLPFAIEAIRDYPGEASPPDGDVLVALDDGALAGQVLVVRHDPTSARIQRLYVRTPYQQRRGATLLMDAAVSLARELAYERLVLDVLTSRTIAIGLYERLGFQPIPPYVDYGVPLTFLALDL